MSKNNDYDILVPHIPRGNDFKLAVRLLENVVVGNHKLEKREIEGTVTITSVNLVLPSCRRIALIQGEPVNGSNTWQINEGNNIVISFFEMLPKGKYGLEIIFLLDGSDRRFSAPPGLGFVIVEHSHEGFVPANTVMTYQVGANVGLGTLVDLSGYPTNQQLNTALANKVDKVNGKDLSTNDFTDEYKEALDEMMENGSAFSTGETVGETGITDDAVENSTDLITSGCVYRMMNAISSGVSVSLTPSPTLIYKNTPTTITLTARMNNASGTFTLEILDGNNQLNTGTSSPLTQSVANLSISGNSKQYNVKGTYLGMVFTASATIQARNPIYVGMGASAAAVAVNGNKMKALSAIGTYSKTASADNQKFYLIVPSDVTAPTKFSMGGAPFAMTKLTNQTINGISGYTVFESGGTYDTGTTLDIEAKNNVI